jgi:hypothetical protein
MRISWSTALDYLMWQHFLTALIGLGQAWMTFG